MRHAKFDEFIMALKSEQTINDLTMIQMKTGLGVNHETRATYRDYNIRLKTIILNYDSSNEIEFLRNVSSMLTIN